jgi:hypothetical protein
MARPRSLQGHVPGKRRNNNVPVGTPRPQQVEGARNRGARLRISSQRKENSRSRGTGVKWERPEKTCVLYTSL